MHNKSFQPTANASSELHCYTIRVHIKIILFLVLVTLPFVVNATTWRESEVNDPILDGEKCSVYEPVSTGGYIYNWSSKYDQVFWPLTDEQGIWFCKKSGFAAFIFDFSDLSPSEISKIKTYLVKNPPEDSTIQIKLELLEKLYELRDTNEAFKNRLLRALARWHQELGDIDKANNYRKEALVGIELSLQKELDEIQRLEYLYLAANYTRQFGDEKASERYLSDLRFSLTDVKSEDVKGFAEYLKELATDTQFIKAGGVLDPELPE